MFDIGFQELVLIGVVALVVIGPERMPAAVRTVALWIGRLKRSFNALKTEIEKEVGADEIRRQLRNEEIMERFRQTQAQVQNSISAVKNDVDSLQKNIEMEANAVAGLETARPAPATSSALDSGVTPASATEPAESPVATSASTTTGQADTASAAGNATAAAAAGDTRTPAAG